MPKLFLHAVNVHQGGGAVLLCDLLRAISSNVEVVLSVDARMGVLADLPSNVRVEQVKPTLSGRFLAECRLAKTVVPNDIVLCFGNLPPLFRLRGQAVVFLQNRYLVDPSAPLNTLPLKSLVRLWLERAWLFTLRHNANRFIVQTPSMQRLAAQRLKLPVSCAPFVPSGVLDKFEGHTKQEFDFLYVASGEGHKNHATLIEAWGLLANDGVFPSLALTLTPEAAPALCERIIKVAASGLSIHNIGVLPHDRLLKIYGSSGALIYPSSFESFGLPLIEARQAGLPILASELDYVRDVIDPDETFDPKSPVSIANAVKRFLKTKVSEERTFMSPSEFLNEINRGDKLT
jgi:glycosyltransferase involved in cell wall biosynthesis